MGLKGNKVLQFVIGAILALAVGAGVVFAIGQEGPELRADSVVVLKSLGLSCGSCASRIDKALRAKPGVASVAVDVDAGRVTVAYDSKGITPETIAETVTAAGYGSSILQTMTADQYQAMTGRKLASLAVPKAGGCGGGCCPTK
ncbi:heavy-metal-associated domain-containing protein [Geobacter sp.]|uniref:heavy-metal-associated domain-containing protein n=1 Tax=Geobacter sp. TaxID=46610 RepID=UPI00261A6DFB|nr:heavy-metal-associated domain-containing protein [Geobacter sp.]